MTPTKSQIARALAAVKELAAELRLVLALSDAREAGRDQAPEKN